MIFKKILVITLVTILFTTSASTVSSARFSILSNNSRDDIKDTGLIEKEKLNFIDSSDDIYIINGDDGIVFLGLHFKRYAPINLPEEFKNEGLKVEFTGKISLMHILTSRGLASLINLKALPIKIIDIKEIGDQTDLDFDISMDDNFFSGEAIPVTAILTNNGNSEIKVNRMSLEGQSLDFNIITPDGKEIRYIGPHINCYPESIVLGPGERNSTVIDLKSENYDFVEDTGEALIPYNFSLDGKYKIKGFYHSFGRDCNPDDQDIWEGNLETEIFEFTINENRVSEITGTVRVKYDIPITLFTPVVNAKVVATSQADFTNASQGNPEGAYITFTDEEGNYKIYAAPDDYKVTVSKEGFETSSSNIHLEDNGDTAIVNFALRPTVNLELDLSIAESFKEGNPLPVEVTLTNNGDYPVPVSEMALNLQTLDFCIVTPEDKTLCYIGPVIKRLPNLTVVTPGPNNAHKIAIEDIKNLFGVDVPYAFEPGEYSIQSHYESGRAIGNDWEGELSSITKSFEISEPQQKFSIDSPKDQEVISGTVDVCVSILNYPPEVEVRIDDGEWIAIECVMSCSISMDCSGYGKYSWDTTQVKDGEHVIEARVYDEPKGEYIYDSVNINVDNQNNPKLQFSIEHPTDGENVSGNVIVTGYTYSEFPLPNIKEIYVSIDRGEWQQAKLYGLGIPNPNKQIGYWEYEWDTTEYSNGEHKIGVMAWNGEKQTYDSIRVIVKNEGIKQ